MLKQLLEEMVLMPGDDLYLTQRPRTENHQQHHKVITLSFRDFQRKRLNGHAGFTSKVIEAAYRRSPSF